MCNTLLQSSYCNVNVKGPGQTTPLSLAAQRGFTNIAAMLLDQGADVHATASITGCENTTALHFACQHGHADIVRLLLNAGASTDAQMIVRGINGVTPLHLAVEAGHMEVMDMLIEAGCDIHSSTKSAEPNGPAHLTSAPAVPAAKDSNVGAVVSSEETNSVNSSSPGKSDEASRPSGNFIRVSGTDESCC